MIILVPEEIYAEFAAEAQRTVPEAKLIPYSESGEAPEDVQEAEALLRWVGGKRFLQLAESAPRLRWLHTASAGVDHVLTPAVRERQGLTVTDSGAAFEASIPEFVLAWMLMTARRLPELIAQQKEHVWRGLTQQQLSGKTVGIVGLGPIGLGVAARAKPFGMRVIGLRRRPLPAEGVDEVLRGAEGLARLLSESDYVVLATALTEQNRAMVGARELAAMKPSAWLINIARGALVDESALIDALTRGAIAGACLDVFAKEPLPPESPLWDMPNVYISPHNSSGGTAALRERQRAIFFENLRRFVRGEPLEGVVDKHQGY